MLPIPAITQLLTNAHKRMDGHHLIKIDSFTGLVEVILTLVFISHVGVKH